MFTIPILPQMNQMQCGQMVWKSILIDERIAGAPRRNECGGLAILKCQSGSLGTQAWPPPSSDVQQIARIKNSRIQLKSFFFTREKFLSVTTAPNIYLKLNNGNIANIYFEKAGSVLVTDVVASEGLVLQRQWNVANCLLVLLSPRGRNRLFLRNSHPLTPLQHSFGRKYRSC